MIASSTLKIAIKNTIYNILDPSCNKYCDLIDQEQVSIPHINL